jgi:hypothetical protein
MMGALVYQACYLFLAGKYALYGCMAFFTLISFIFHNYIRFTIFSIAFSGSFLTFRALSMQFWGWPNTFWIHHMGMTHPYTFYIYFAAILISTFVFYWVNIGIMKKSNYKTLEDFSKDAAHNRKIAGRIKKRKDTEIKRIKKDELKQLKLERKNCKKAKQLEKIEEEGDEDESDGEIIDPESIDIEDLEYHLAMQKQLEDREEDER